MKTPYIHQYCSAAMWSGRSKGVQRPWQGETKRPGLPEHSPVCGGTEMLVSSQATQGKKHLFTVSSADGGTRNPPGFSDLGVVFKEIRGCKGAACLPELTLATPGSENNSPPLASTGRVLPAPAVPCLVVAVICPAA